MNSFISKNEYNNLEDITLRLKRLAGSIPDKVMLEDESGNVITYKEADEITGRICTYLKNKNLHSESFVVISQKRSVWPVLTALGVLKAGCCFVCLDASYPKSRTEFIYKDCNASALITDKDIPHFYECEISEKEVYYDPHMAACALYTSGSTGNPKGVLYERGKFPLIAKSVSHDGQDLFSSETRMGLITPFYFLPAWCFIAGLLYKGASAYVISIDTSKTPSLLKKLLSDIDINTFYMTPSYAKLLGGVVTSGINLLFVGAESCAGLSITNARVICCYAMTESGFIIRSAEITDSDQLLYKENSLPIDLHVSEETGEIIFKNLFTRGYINLEAQNHLSFADDGFHTCDCGKMTEDGSLLIFGRIDDMVKINGNRIDITEVELTFSRLFEISDCAIKVIERNNKKYLALYYVNGVRMDIKHVQNKMSEVLPEYMIPSYFAPISEIPHTESGKVNRRALPDPVIETASKQILPANKLEKQLFDAFCEVLEDTHISVTDDFFSIGGDSLGAIRVITLAGIFSLSVSDIYRWRSIREIVENFEKSISDYSRFKDSGSRDRFFTKYPQPLTPEQAYVMDYQFYSPVSTMYCLPYMFRLSDDIDLDRLERALHLLIYVHPALKTELYVEEDGSYWQKYNKDIKNSVFRTKMTSRELCDYVKDPVRPFERLFNAPLTVFNIIETPGEAYLYFCIHHIICDGTSMGLLLRDMYKLYCGVMPRRDHYFYYLMETAQVPLGNPYKLGRKYFESRYLGKKYVNHMHFDHDTRENENDNFHFDLELKRDVLTSPRLNLDSPSAFFVLAGLLALSVTESEKNVQVSWIYNGRDEAYKSDIVGLLFYFLPAALELTDETKIGELLAEVTRQMADGIQNCDYPFVTTNSPIITGDSICVLFQDDLRNVPEESKAILCEEIELPSQMTASQNLLDVEILNDNGELIGFFDYNSSIYDEKSIRHYAETFRTICHMLLEDNVLSKKYKEFVTLVNNNQIP